MSSASHAKDSFIRAFVAIKLPLAIRQELSQFGRLYVDIPPHAIRWVDASNIHLTLRFLGDTSLSILDPLGQSIRENIADLTSFELNLGQLGCFPNPRRARILWVGLGGDLNKLSLLQKRIEDTVIRFGWEPERRKFHPHLTIGRVKDSRVLGDGTLPYGQKMMDAAFGVESIALIESVLAKSGAIYNVRFRCSLGKN